MSLNLSSNSNSRGHRAEGSSTDHTTKPRGSSFSGATILIIVALVFFAILHVIANTIIQREPPSDTGAISSLRSGD
jgi:hypothetical protein